MIDCNPPRKSRAVSPTRFLDTLASARPQQVEISHCLFGHIRRWECPLRTTDRHLLWLVTDGRLVGRVANQPVTLEANQVQWLLPGTPHEFKTDPLSASAGIYSMGFRLHTDHRGSMTIRGRGRYFQMRAHEPRVLYDRVILAWQRLAGNPSEPSLGWHGYRALLTALLAEIMEDDKTKLSSGELEASARWRLEKFADEHIAQAFTATDLAKLVRLSPDYFTRVFRSAYGMSPRRWITERRLQRANLMLSETILSIKEIATACGYNDQRFFSRQFKSRFGLTPSAHRHRL